MPDSFTEEAPAPEHQFGDAGGGCVFGELDRQRRHRLHTLADVDAVPLVGLLRRHLEQILPAAQAQRRGNADAAQARQQFRPQPHGHAVQRRFDLAEYGVGDGKRIGPRQALARLADEIDQQHVQDAPADLDADREGAIRIEHDRHRRLADLAAHRRALADQALPEQAVDDQGNPLRAQVGQPGQVGLGHAAVQAHRLQHHPLVELAHAHLVRAARLQPWHIVDGRLRRGRFG